MDFRFILIIKINLLLQFYHSRSHFRRRPLNASFFFHCNSVCGKIKCWILQRRTTLRCQWAKSYKLYEIESSVNREHRNHSNNISHAYCTSHIAQLFILFGVPAGQLGGPTILWAISIKDADSVIFKLKSFFKYAEFFFLESVDHHFFGKSC